MAKTTDAVERLLLEVWDPAKKKASAERRGARGHGPRRGAQRASRTVGLALLRREGPSRPIRSRRGRGEALLRPRQHGRGGVRHRRASVRPDLYRPRRSAGLPSRCSGVGGARPRRQSCRPVPARQFRPARQAFGRLVEPLPRSAESGRAGGADRRQQQQFFEIRLRGGRAHSIELRRRRDPVSRIRSRSAFIAEPGAVSLAIRHRGAPRFRRVPVAGFRALDVRTGEFAQIRPPLRNRRANP